VVKELMENSIDAGATRINVNIEDGGRKLISITDNGCGIDAEDLPLAFCPHATSKLKTSADLLNISTMGFRGEALASIGSVAQVSIVSKRHDAIEANRIEVDCGQKSGILPCSSSEGTTVEVANLFYKLPGRRKFLRTANTEMSHISEQFRRIALPSTGLDLTLSHNGREIYRLTRDMELKDRIVVLLSKEMTEGLIEIRGSERNLEMNGYLSLPEKGRANSKYQYVFLNGRFIRDKFITHAIKEAYRGMIQPDRFPIVFLFLKIPPQNFDVNVHPTKVEVRFDNSNLVHSQVLGVIREKLLGINLDVSGKLDGGGYGDVLHGTSGNVVGAMADYFKNHNPADRSQGKFDFSTITKTSDLDASQTRQRFYREDSFSMPPAKKDFLQIHDSYILAGTEDGFIIIDQHAMHERIIYEQLCKKLDHGSLESQRLLVPESFELTAEQIAALEANGDLLKKLGIETEAFGPGTVAVQAFPSLLNKVKPADFMLDMLDILCESASQVDAVKIIHKVLDMAACKAAVKAGQKLSETEISQILADKQAVSRASRCPHGRPTTIKMTVEQLEKQFGRT